MKLLKNKYVQSLLRHAVAAAGVYVASQGIPEAWLTPVLAFGLSALDKFKNQ